ncbi:MAG: hypothetical protein A2653_00825 [Candidatus Zambryskibacteria bacterium RIFCSPHIGHO2_01_FULL_43_25]|uniref:Uncharacterized protein n=1 Tax=Candidatus Zambryskibacteria bacterium RIFCSPLOWO2_01_FULL_45_21 TaxID=1802761 RepID=A0A1G2U4L6_9BACT|nr:MAG: hypothetical protein A2653_00825 [Candidatus Zambryskibacteria bacterium RIFCSPHIGHO2_01_FULL_43_25]OHB00631.1 MAG: hypothetical protein A3E94_03305 [Candidatus Zambryskibacteria bacterium RIFCSPHIGHO2_12_FULL_44_12b]OHB04446.1 MAG: hypothetical protein A3B14_03350 [Candidatus Zambryskibacteria bacterium RIFCSPLOWO2_01_FULL_45_21]
MAGIKLTFDYLSKNLAIVIGLVLIWRGIWYVLDEIDLVFLGGSHFFTAVGGIILGLAILYIPDHDLKEIQKL